MLLLLCIVCAASNAQRNVEFNTTAFSIRGTDTNWSKWYKSDLKIFWNFDTNKIIIRTNETQVFDYGSIYTEETPELYYYTALGLDKDRTTMRFELYSYKKTGWFFLKICYSNAEYKYKMYLNRK